MPRTKSSQSAHFAVSLLALLKPLDPRFGRLSCIPSAYLASSCMRLLSPTRGTYQGSLLEVPGDKGLCGGRAARLLGMFQGQELQTPDETQFNECLVLEEDIDW